MKEGVRHLKALLANKRLLSIYKSMLFYCLKCRRNTESENTKLAKAKKRRTLLSFIAFIKATGV